VEWRPYLVVECIVVSDKLLIIGWPSWKRSTIDLTCGRRARLVREEGRIDTVNLKTSLIRCISRIFGLS
jgi:hypothetical protein